MHIIQTKLEKEERGLQTNQSSRFVKCMHIHICFYLNCISSWILCSHIISVSQECSGQFGQQVVAKVRIINPTLTQGNMNKCLTQVSQINLFNISAYRLKADWRARSALDIPQFLKAFYILYLLVWYNSFSYIHYFIWYMDIHIYQYCVCM